MPGRKIIQLQALNFYIGQIGMEHLVVLTNMGEIFQLIPKEGSGSLKDCKWEKLPALPKFK